MKCFFNEKKWGEAVRACYNRDLAYMAIGCEIQQDDVLELVPIEWYGRYKNPFPAEKLEETLTKVAEWKFGESAVFNTTKAYEKSKAFGEF